MKLSLVISAIFFFAFTLHAFSQADKPAQIFISVPNNVKGANLNLFFDKRMMSEISPGNRFVFNIAYQELLKVSVLSTREFVEPSTLSKRTRTIDVKRGKEYYFEIGRDGAITYFSDAVKGKAKFEAAQNFAGLPKPMSASTADSSATAGN